MVAAQAAALSRIGKSTLEPTEVDPSHKPFYHLWSVIGPVAQPDRATVS